jgi:cyclomaltodextrinase
MFDSTMNYIFRNAVLDHAAGGPAGEMVANLEAHARGLSAAGLSR